MMVAGGAINPTTKKSGRRLRSARCEVVNARSRLLPDQASHLVRRTQTKILEPQERAKLHNALTVGPTD